MICGRSLIHYVLRAVLSWHTLEEFTRLSSELAHT